jgi:hypothetical protein
LQIAYGPTTVSPDGKQPALLPAPVISDKERDVVALSMALIVFPVDTG